ncbi:hypothetical protein VB776_01465 [Arcicella sp. DC2W]|uniref:Uncharacterized protein n=1 Tax=Arcicella gelida TaxID=2984195 RepID=A0ABU5RZC4_9BACT|nr:hypothetical protein [Arcicella sp. DC2W]MEA5401564.1 hypothetical protein [Arcicella sp. DC2W]
METLNKEKKNIEFALNNNNELNEINSFLQQEIDAIGYELCNKIDNTIIPKLKNDYGIDFSAIESVSKNIAKKIREDVEYRKH